MGSPSCASPDSFLRDARLFNSDLGRHSVKCNFSNRLAGRFYQNGSLERHTFRRIRLAEMQESKRRLEEELRAEERRIELMKERLEETERLKDNAFDLIGTIMRGLALFQASARRRQAMESFRAMRRKVHARSAIARFLQCRYRGWTGRVHAESRRRLLRRKGWDEAAAVIQANVRMMIQRLRYISEKERLRLATTQSTAVVLIQATVRGTIARRMYKAEMRRRRDAASNIERVWRGHAARITTRKVRCELIPRIMEAEKPKRIQLHLRRSNTHIKSTAKTQLRNLNIVSSTGDDTGEDGSIASTLTSLTNQMNATTKTPPKNRVHHQPTSPPTWLSPRRVVPSDRLRVTAIRPRNRGFDTKRGAPIERSVTTSPISHRKLQEGCTQSLSPMCNDLEPSQSIDKNEAR